MISKLGSVVLILVVVPHKYTTPKRNMPLLKNQAQIEELSQVCNISQNDAKHVLSLYKNNLSRAADAVFSGEVKVSKTTNKVSKTKISVIFDKFQEEDGEIGIDGTIKFLKELDVAPEEPVVLTLAHKLQSPGEGRFSREGFIDGWKSLGADSLKKMKETVVTLKQDLQNREGPLFEETYEFAFKYNLQDGQRMLPLETAVAYWDLLLSGDKFAKIDEWTTFVQEVYKKSVSRDTWKMILEFARYLDQDPQLTEYDAEGAWPSVIDEFVDYLKQK